MRIDLGGEPIHTRAHALVAALRDDGRVLARGSLIDLRTAQDSSAERVGEDASAALLQRLLRHSFYARRDLDGYVIPRLDALLAGLRTQPADPTMAVDLRVLEVLHRLG